MESPTFDSFDVAAVKIEASEECSNNANNTDFNNLCWLKKDNQDQVDDVLMAAEQKYQFNDDLNNILDPSLIKAHNQDGDEQEHVNLNNQNNLPCIKELNGAEGNNDHEIENDINTENNHNLDETENDKNNLVSFDDFGPETSVDEIAVPEEKLSEHEELVPMETTTSSSPSIEVTTNTFDELIFQEKAEEVIITPSSDLDDDSVDKQLSSVDNTNTLSEVDEEVPEKMVFEHDEDDILKSPVKQHVEEDILKSPESEPSIDQNIIVEEQSFIANSEHNFELEEAKFDHEVDVQVDDVGVVADNADIDDNKNIFTDEQHFESTMNDSKANIVESAVQQPVQDSCDESDEEWNYMKAKEGQTEKENNVLSEEFKENIEPVTEKEFSSVELKEQLDTTPEPVAICDPVVAEIPATPELVSPVVVDDLQTTPDMMMDENNFHLNPEAKEFVPNTYASPTHEEAEQQNGEVDTLQVKQPYRHVFDDVVSQSPRKGRESNMDDFLLPAENDFDVEIANRPHELLQEEVKMEEGEEKEVEEPQNENELLIQNALDNVGMKDSLYVENTSSGFNNGEVDLLNTIQPLPEVEVEENNVLSNKEGLSLEIDEKDVISPSSEDIKEIVTEIEEKVKEMNIVEEPLVSPPEIEVSQPEPTMDVSAEISQSVFEITPPVFEISQNNFEEELKQVEETKPIEESAPVQEELKPVEEIKPEEVKLTEEPKPVEETPTFNGEINVEELNKKNLEESAKLDAPVDNVPVEEAPVKIEESKLLEATLGVVAVTAAATATIKASSAKKSPATKPATLSAAKKPTTTTTARKLGTSSTTATPAAARPKTAPVKSTIERKPTATRTTTVTAAKPRIDIKKTTTTTSTLSKPKEVTKTTEIKKTTTTTSARSTVPKATSATAARPRPTTASSLTNGISKTSTASRTSSTTSSTLKPTTTSAAAPKPRLSPRSTVSSTLRKAETLKSPSATKAAPSSSRIDSGLKNGKPATCPAKPSTLRATKPAMGTVSTPSNRLTVKSTITTTSSQRKTASPLDKKKTLAPATTLNSARKSLSLTKTPIKSPGAKPIQKPVQAEPVVIEVAQEVVAAPSPPEAAAVAVDVPIA
ncbi:PPM1E family protein [Megaselia abdita]